MTMRNKKSQIKRCFTIVEIVVAMTVFALLMLIIMQIFGSMQNVWATTSGRTQTHQSVRVVMDMITSDLQSAFYDPEAKYWESWCYYQKNASGYSFDENSRLWFVTHRQKSVQAKNSPLVQTGYWLEKMDGGSMYRLKNAIVSNVGEGEAKDCYNYHTADEPHSGLTGTISSEVSKYAVTLAENIISLKISPMVKTYKSGTQWNLAVTDCSGSADKLPSYVKIELEILDDPANREAYLAATGDDKKIYIKKFTRLIEIERGQYYEQAGGS